MSDRQLIEFAGFQLDGGQRVLRRGEQKINVEPKAFDLLMYLATHRDRAVDKDELQQAVWPGTIVSETALTRCVMKARRAVDDDRDTQAIIRTVHGHGYQFVADIGPPATTHDPETSTAISEEHQGPVGGELVHHAVSQGVTEWDAEFEYVDFCAIKGEGEFSGGVEIRVSSRNVRDKTLLVFLLQFGEAFNNSIHTNFFSTANERE